MVSIDGERAFDGIGLGGNGCAVRRVLNKIAILAFKVSLKLIRGLPKVVQPSAPLTKLSRQSRVLGELSR